VENLTMKKSLALLTCLLLLAPASFAGTRGARAKKVAVKHTTKKQAHKMAKKQKASNQKAWSRPTKLKPIEDQPVEKPVDLGYIRDLPTLDPEPVQTQELLKTSREMSKDGKPTKFDSDNDS
jgi:hypothetical protein